MQKLKEKLLNTGYFIDNNYLEEYVKLVKKDSQAAYLERHHILPRAYYNVVDIEVDNSDNNLVCLSFAEHCKAHWLLYYCTISRLQYAMQTAFVMMVSGLTKFAKCIEDYTETDFIELQEMKSQLIEDSSTFWSASDEEYLRQNFLKRSDEEMASKLNRTTAAVSDRRHILGLCRINMQPDYSEEEINYMITNYYTKTINEIADDLNRSRGAVAAKCNSLGLKKRYVSKWTDDELEFLRQNSHTMSITEIASSLGRGVQGVQRQCQKHKIRCKRINIWTESEINYLKENYSKMTYRQLAKQLGRTPEAVHTRCKMLHLVKK